MPKLIVRGSSSNEHYNADCDFVLVSIDQDYARELLNRIALAKEQKEKDMAFASIAFHDDSPEPFGYADFLDEYEIDGQGFEEAIDEDGTLVLSDDFELPGDVTMERIECSRVLIYADSDTSWEFTPRHSDITIWCGWVTKDLLEKIADGDKSIEKMPEKKQETAV